MTALRKEIYKDDKGLVVILGVVCAALLAVTAFGIVGLTSYWVAQRRRQIGIRRALGATRNAIIQYFQTENLLIAGAGRGDRGRPGGVAEPVDGERLFHAALEHRIRPDRRGGGDVAGASRGAVAGS